jgi:hypothetical protein
LNISTELLNGIPQQTCCINVNLELINPACEWDVEDSDESDDTN